MAWANSSFPVPLSPSNSTVQFVAAILSIVWIVCRIWGAWVMMESNTYRARFPITWLARALTERLRRRSKTAPSGCCSTTIGKIEILQEIWCPSTSSSSSANEKGFISFCKRDCSSSYRAPNHVEIERPNNFSLLEHKICSPPRLIRWMHSSWSTTTIPSEILEIAVSTNL